ncbi:MAG TPA: efflux RND transporter periplasmic adaptor subunit [Terriglobales bacterium]|nr:efflux RND transporter periplasmic adaptor subunit [Terriglobales bacterium]
MDEFSIRANQTTATDSDATIETVRPDPIVFATQTRAPRPPKLGRPAILLAAVGIVIAGATFVATDRSTVNRVSVTSRADTAVAVTRNFVKVVRLTGTTEALRSRPVLAPQLAGAQLSTMVVTKLVASGARVHKGDLLVQFDRQSQIKDALDKKGAYEDLVDQVIEKRAAENAARAKDVDDLQQARDALAKAQLEMSKNEILSRIDVEKNQEALAEAEQNLKQLQHTFELKRQAAAADIRTVEIQRDRAKATMLYAESNAQKMLVLSPMEGVVVLNNVWLGSRMGQVQEGDEVRPGVPFMKVIDPSEMRVRVEVNQEDLLSLHEGQDARITLDAYPKLSFTGTLEELDPLGHPSEQANTIRTFAAIFTIHGANSKLMPDLSAAVDVQLDNVKNAIVIPEQAIAADLKGQYVWLRSKDRFNRHAVKAGPSDGINAVIEAGLAPGDIVRLIAN